jgi:hypothetical protein
MISSSPIPIPRAASTAAGSNVGVDNNRGDAKERQGGGHGTEAHADQGGDQSDHRELGNRAPGVADPDRQEFAPAAVAEVEADWQGDDQRQRQRQHGHLEVSQ